MKSDNEQSDLPTVTHQNGFSSTMTIGVPTFNSRLIHLFIHLECSRYMFTANTCGKHERKAPWKWCSVNPSTNNAKSHSRRQSKYTVSLVCPRLNVYGNIRKSLMQLKHHRLVSITSNTSNSLNLK